MTLLYKDKDRTDLKNWRPITLLNFDCKLLASRLSVFLKDLIHPDQACAIPGRRITDSLLLIRDTICFARDRNIRLVVLNLDFEKAFDRVLHQYLFQVLKKNGISRKSGILGTMEGKVLITKAVILPLLLLIGSVFMPPRRVLLDPDRAMFYFLWGSKWERLR